MNLLKFLGVVLLILLFVNLSYSFKGTSLNYNSSFQISSMSSVSATSTNYELNWESLLQSGFGISSNYGVRFGTLNYNWSVYFSYPKFNISFDNSSSIIIGTKNNKGYYPLSINFSTDQPTICSDSYNTNSLTTLSTYSFNGCSGLGCSYTVSGGGGNGGGLSSRTLFESSYSTNHEYLKNLSSSKKIINLFCSNVYDLESNYSTPQFIIRESSLNVESAKIRYPYITPNGSNKLDSIISHNYKLTNTSIIHTLPSGENTSFSVIHNKNASFETELEINITSNTSQFGLHSLNITFYDNNTNSYSFIERFRVVNYTTDFRNISIKRTGGDFNFDTQGIDPKTDILITNYDKNNINFTILNSSFNISLTFDNDLKIEIPLTNQSSPKFNVKARKIENISDSNTKIGDNSRYKPLISYSFDLDNASNISNNYKITLGYVSLKDKNPSKIVIFKAPFNFTTNSTDFSSGIFYKVGDPTYPVYIDNLEAYIFVDSFSSFTLVEDQAVSEICNNSNDDDFDGQIDEGCSSGGGGSSGGSGGGSSSSSGGGYIDPNTYNKIEKPLENIEKNFNVKINGETNLSKEYTGINKIILKSKKNKINILEFEHNFSKESLNLSNFKLTENNDIGNNYVIVSGLNLKENQTKKIRLKTIENSNKVCIKDSDINLVSEISENCNGFQEYILTCDGSNQKGYSCIELNGLYEITGLKHSGILELENEQKSIVNNFEEPSQTNENTNLEQNNQDLNSNTNNLQTDKQSSYWWFVLAIILILGLVAGFVVFKMKKQKTKHQNNQIINQLSPEVYNKEYLNAKTYIQNYKNQYTKEQLYKALIDQKYDPGVLNKIFEEEFPNQ